MRKPWSLSTTVRNPDRLRDLLIVLQKLEGDEWNEEAQNKYQTFLIQERLYGYGSRQFYNGLAEEDVRTIDDSSKPISFEVASKIFESKNYEDSAIRGRQSFNPLKKFGLARIDDKKVVITDLGKLFLKEDYDYEEIFFKAFLKWQLPNPDSTDYKKEDGYNVKPFIGVLHLIDRVNKKCEQANQKQKGISKQEFSLFCPLLVNYNDIDSYAEKIMLLRNKMDGKSKKEQRSIFEDFQKQFVLEFRSNDTKGLDTFLKNLKDYGDNAIRYFRLTRFLYIRGNGFYVDLEPRRSIEIANLLKFDNASAIDFENKEAYLDYMSNISEPQLPWETKAELLKIIDSLVRDVQDYERKLQLKNKEVQDYRSLDVGGLKSYISDLKLYRKELQDKEAYAISQNTSQIEDYIDQLQNIFSYDDKPIRLEKLLSLGLSALNDAITIKPNYPVGDDNEPTFTAPANTPDIECYYENFNAICEVTMLKGRDQWYNEGQPVMRHLRNFEEKNSNKPSYCLFIAPTLHRDTLNTFWFSVKYEYEGQKQNIIPLQIKDFVSILKVLLTLKRNGRFLQHTKILDLYDNIIGLSQEYSNSQDWMSGISGVIDNWGKNLCISC